MLTTAAASSTWLTGFTVCLSLIASIGAQNLYVLRQAVQGEHVRACVAWCVVSDALLVALGVAGMAQLLGRSPTLAQWLQWGGALFLLAYGLFAWHRALFAPGGGMDAAGGARVVRGVLGVVSGLAVITLLNPHVYLDTVVLIGSISAQHAPHGLAFGIAAACASLSFFAALGFGARLLAPVFAKPRAWVVLEIGVGLPMWALAAGLAFGA